MQGGSEEKRKKTRRLLSRTTSEYQYEVKNPIHQPSSSSSKPSSTAIPIGRQQQEVDSTPMCAALRRKAFRPGLQRQARPKWHLVHRWICVSVCSQESSCLALPSRLMCFTHSERSSTCENVCRCFGSRSAVMPGGICSTRPIVETGDDAHSCGELVNDSESVRIHWGVWCRCQMSRQ